MSGKPGNRLPAHQLIAAPSPGAPVLGERRTLLCGGAQDPKGWRGLWVREQRGSLSSRGARCPRRGRGPPSLEAALDLRLRNPNPAHRLVEGGTRGRQSPAASSPPWLPPAEHPAWWAPADALQPPGSPSDQG